MRFWDRFFRQTAPMRWWRCAVVWARGTKLHPTAWLNCSLAQIRLGSGTSIGARTRVELGLHASLVTGRKVWLSSDIEIQTNTSVLIGARTTVQRRGTINGNVRIGADCIIAPNVFISSGTHPFRITPHLLIRCQETLQQQKGVDGDRPIWIQDDCWLGVNAVICPGVTVGRGSVVGANAVVTRDIPPYTVATGIPARVTGLRMNWIPPQDINLRRAEDQPYVLSGRTIYQPDGKPVGVDVGIDHPLCVVLAKRKEATFIDLMYETTEPAVLHIGDENYSLPVGSGAITLPTTVLEDVENHVVLRAELLTNSFGQSVRVFGLRYRSTS